MSVLAIIGLGILFMVVAGWSLYEFFRNAQRFAAPDIADRDEIEARHGAGTPEAQAALARRFGRGSHWRDAATALGGLGGMLLLLWIWLG